MTTKSKIQVGDKVKLTGKFLKSTGQFKGPAGLSTWVVTAITPNGWAVTNQAVSNATLESFAADELAADPSLKFRRIALANLYVVGTLTTENCP